MPDNIGFEKYFEKHGRFKRVSAYIFSLFLLLATLAIPYFVSSDCFKREISDMSINFLKGLFNYAAFFTSGTTAVAP